MSAEPWQIAAWATANEREAAFCELQAKALWERARRHREAARSFREQVAGVAR